MITLKEATTIKTTVRQEITMRLTPDIIIRALENCGITVPDSAEITVHIPGGGDWSNTDLDISDAHPVIVSWTTEQERS